MDPSGLLLYIEAIETLIFFSAEVWEECHNINYCQL